MKNAGAVEAALDRDVERVSSLLSSPLSVRLLMPGGEEWMDTSQAADVNESVKQFLEPQRVRKVLMGGRAIPEGVTWLDTGAEDGARVSVVCGAASVDLSGEPQVVARADTASCG